MIRLRLHAFSNNGETKITVIPGEPLDKAVERVLENVPLGDLKKEDIFQVLHNGLKVEPELWSVTRVQSSDSVLVAPRIKGDTEASLFKQFAVIAVTVAASTILGPAIGIQAGTITSALFAAGSAMVAGLALNALIPPPIPDAASVGGSSPLSDSQAYSISSQANVTRKFQTVPKVYGTHRFFPPVAANPYTEVEVDPETKELVQYLYAIYDLGFGPVQVENIFIGDNSIGQYSDVQYTIVDPHKPAVSEGRWDDVAQNTFRFYKGDVDVTAAAVVLDGNRASGDAQESWEAVRNSAENVDGVPQSITLTFVNPRGLIAYSPNGTTENRSIDLEIYFSKVGEDNWYAFNDLTQVESFLAVGGDETYKDTPLELYPPVPNNFNLDFDPYYTELLGSRTEQIRWFTPGPGPTPQPVYNITVGYQSNQARVIQKPGAAPVSNIPSLNIVIVAKDNPRLEVGATLAMADGRIIGTILSLGEYAANHDYTEITVRRPSFDMELFKFYGTDVGGPPDSWSPVGGFNTLGNKIYIKSIVTGRARITRSETSPVYSTYRFTPKNPGQYKIRVTRVSTYSANTFQTIDSLEWSTITTRFERQAIQSDKRHTYLEMRIRATNQLNGAIANLSVQATSILDSYDPNTQTWNKIATSNPAWIFVDLLTGQVNKRAIDKSRLHLPSISEWAEFCEEAPTPPSGHTYSWPRFSTNFILDYETTLQQILAQVAAAGQASLNIIDGKYGVLVDKLRTVPVQVFTPRNSRDFSSTRVYSKTPNAIRVKYIEPGLNWNVAEKTVYDNGFNESNVDPTKIEEITAFGVTNDEQAWRFGRYMMAQNKLRQETITITVDFEYLVCTRGDYVQVSQDVMKVGGTPARVKSVTSNQFTIDDSIETLEDEDYACIFRRSDGTMGSATLEVVNSNTFNVEGGGDIPEKGDLVVVGVAGSVVIDCIVKSISPNDDMTATLVLVEKADAIYEAESTDTFPPYDAQLSPTVNADFQPPGEVRDLVIADSGYECDGFGYLYFATLDWGVPDGSAFEYFQIFVNTGKGFTEVDQTRKTTYNYIVDLDDIGKEHSFKVIAVSAAGKKLDIAAVEGVSYTPTTKSDPPSSVERLDIDITGETLQLIWPSVEDCDLSQYLIRYSPNVSDTWDSSVPLARAARSVTLVATQARTGIYFIKAVDFAGNESSAAAAAITTIPSLTNLNVIEETTDFPDLDGAYDRVEDSGGVLVLKKAVTGITGMADEYYSEGFYYYKDLLDLGEIYTVRLQSSVRAEGFTSDDMMSNWTSLDAVLALANSRFSEWDVETQYRSTEAINVMADWLTLDAIDPIGGGAVENFTEWRKFTIGDATGRIFQFRLRLVSKKPSVTPRVFDGTIKADMPDRSEIYSNLVITVPNDGVTVEYDPAFKGPGSTPNVQVTIDDAEAGDHIEYLSKTLEGFTIRVLDVTDNPVARQIDVAVRGYGRRAESVI